MAKLTKAASRKRLKEAMMKIQAVYMSGFRSENMSVTTADMTAMEKILSKCMNRLK
jgi:hypothetical protein